MSLPLTKPLACFDLEATGLNTVTDRIVEISIIKLNPDGSEESLTERLNPTVPISTEASTVHGLYYDDIKDEPTFKERAKHYDAFLKGCDLCGFNLIRFDIPMLVEEFLRAEVDFNIDSRSIVDAQRIFHIMEPRNLSAAYKFYCDKNLENAHSAEADTRATMDILLAQVEKYEGTEVKKDVKELHKLTTSKFADLTGRLVFDADGEEAFNFGKYRGKKVTEVFAKDPSYYDWIMKSDFALYTKKKLTEIKLRSIGTRT
ncbi:MAG: exonuclease domain-containing protein [Cyclobacteriaceae bacterium]